ncbi:MAG: hypothetical protein HY423_04210 [Candidatus Lambdaproteobacteria bacterium]|nr:hypothetical protein [Candidatus Lambdaproteobacteria bacterium]
MGALLSWMQENGWVVAWIALLLSFMSMGGRAFTWISTWLQQSESRKKAIKANLVSRIEKTAPNLWRLFIENESQNEARDILIMLSGMPITEHPVFPRGQSIGSVLGPHSSAKYLIAPHMGMNPAPPWPIEIRWSDDSGTMGLYRSELTL